MLLRRIARPLLSAAFIGQGIDALRSPKLAAEAAAPTLEGLQRLPGSAGASVPKDAVTFARVNAAVQIGGGVLLATGKVPRLASAALAATVIPANLGAHMFWTEIDPERKAAKRRDFLTDLSLLGGLVIASADTAGKPSLGWRGRRAAQKVSGSVSDAVSSVSSALPGGVSTGSALHDSDLPDKIGHGLAVGAGRGRELAGIAAEKSAPLADAARHRAWEFAEKAADKSAPLADAARARAIEFAEIARDRGADWSELARERGAELAEGARDRGADLAETARDQGEDLAGSARRRAKAARKAAKKR
jgi:uncharacterized membrane protein YphA (DoxX/SURF4 family)